MTASLRTTCASCGVVEVPVPDAVLVMTVEATDDDASSDSYDARSTVEFQCPNCSLRGSQRVDERATRLLSDAGVRMTMARQKPQVPATDSARSRPESDPR